MRVHTTTQAAVDTVEGHLAALQAQQKLDQDYFLKIYENMENIQRDGKQLEIEMQGLKDGNVFLRRELFTVRDAIRF